MSARRIALVAGLTICGLTHSAFAADDIIKGAYGNKEGCHYAKTEESSGADVFFLLNKDGITTAASVCTFKGLVSKTKDTTSVKVTCEDESGESSPEETLNLIHASNDTYRIVFKDGTTWGPLKKCR